jgi:hypothetical protein
MGIVFGGGYALGITVQHVSIANIVVYTFTSQRHNN